MICAYKKGCELYKKYEGEFCGRVCCNHFEENRVYGLNELLKGVGMHLPSIERVARTVHEQWIQSRVERGATSCKAEDGEELMVPYDQLSEKQKEKDRNIVRAVYAAIEEEERCHK